ncbi:Uncharacterized protein Rs2_45022 [Raphanus sativus]|nr:Uncharacterized protein Rs2_45022 [Raphanus sativus]
MIFSGQRVSVISSLCEYDPFKCEYSWKNIQESELHSLSYLMIGQGLATVAIRVAIERSDPSDMSVLMKGLRLLSRWEMLEEDSKSLVMEQASFPTRRGSSSMPCDAGKGYTLRIKLVQF